jgi:methylase of polypeptide subunit release factors
MQDNRLYISPAGKEKPLSRVLDLGTGTGIWAIDLGTRVPKMLTVG